MCKTLVQHSLERWMETFPKWERGSCCHDSHFDDNWNPLPDYKVCERERYWRNYVRLRDGKPDWPFVSYGGIRV